MPPCTCSSPDALDWIRRVFRECVSDDRELLGFYLALITVACWMTAQIPQLFSFSTKVSSRIVPVVSRAVARRGLVQSHRMSRHRRSSADADVHGGVLCPERSRAVVSVRVLQRASRRAKAKAPGWPDDEDSSNASLYDALRSEDGAESSGGESATDPRVRGEGARGSMSPIGGFVLAALAALSGPAATAASRGDTDGAVASSGVLRSALQVDDCEYNGNPQWMQNFGRGVGYLATAFYLGGRFGKSSRRIGAGARRRGSV